jgi:hypothetical protein
MRRRRVFRPVLAGLFAVMTLALAPWRLGPGPLWAAVLLGVNAIPWLLGLRVARRRPRGWRLSQDGLEQCGRRGRPLRRYPLVDIGELVVIADTGMLTVTDAFGFRLFAAPLRALGFDLLPLWCTARALDITIEVFDSDPDVVGTGGRLPPGHNEETQRRLLALEAALLASVHGERGTPAASPRPVLLVGRRPHAPHRLGLLAARGSIAAAAACGLWVTASTAEYRHLPERALGGVAAVVTAFALASLARVRRETAAISWSIDDRELRVRQETVGHWRVALDAIGAVAPYRGSLVDPRTGATSIGLVAYLFGHGGEFIHALPYGTLAAERVAIGLREHGVQVLEGDLSRPERAGAAGGSGGLFGPLVLPRLFRVLPAGQLLIDADGLHWTDLAAGERLTVPAERIGSIELRTSHGHAWMRLRDAGGDVVLHAPLAALRTRRTEVREGARRAGLPVIDREYDAYFNARFTEVIRGFHEPPAPAEPAARLAAHAPAAAGAPPRGVLAASVGQGGDGPAAGAGPGGSGGVVVIDPSRRTRRLGHVFLPLGMLLLGGLVASNLRPFVASRALLGGIVGLGLLLGALAAWRRGRSRPRLALSGRGVAGVSRRGRPLWRHDRRALGGVEVDEYGRTAQLVLWSASGRELWRQPLDAPPAGLRELCAAHRLPWGAPTPGRQVSPPPEQ